MLASPSPIRQFLVATAINWFSAFVFSRARAALLLMFITAPSFTRVRRVAMSLLQSWLLLAAWEAGGDAHCSCIEQRERKIWLCSCLAFECNARCILKPVKKKKKKNTRYINVNAVVNMAELMLPLILHCLS